MGWQRGDPAGLAGAAPDAAGAGCGHGTVLLRRPIRVKRLVFHGSGAYSALGRALSVMEASQCAENGISEIVNIVLDTDLGPPR